MEAFKNMLKTSVKDHTEVLKRFVLSFKSEGKELEIRLGRIIRKEEGTRMRMDTVAPVVFRNLPPEFKFESVVDIEDFKRLKDHVSPYVCKKREDTIIINEDGRETYEMGELKKVERKEMTERFDIYMPRKKYDVRLVLSEEVETLRVASKKTTLIKRRRFRETYFVEPYIFDFTEVISFDGRIDEKERKKFEVEVEISNQERVICEEFVSLMYNFNVDIPFLRKDSRKH